MATLAASASAALGDPAVVVSFSRTTSGTTAAAASAFCCPPAEVIHNCQPGPHDYFLSGNVFEMFTAMPQAVSVCGAACSDTAGSGGQGGGTCSATVSVDLVQSSELQTNWGFHHGLFTGVHADASSGPCASGSASGSASTSATWDLTFDVGGGPGGTGRTTRLVFQHLQSVSASGSGSASLTCLLTGEQGTLFEQAFSITDGNDTRFATDVYFLTPGRYTLAIATAAQASASAPGGPENGGAGSAGEFALEFIEYDCPVITSQPTDAPDARCLGAATFSVTADGTDVTYQWRHEGQPLVNGPSPGGANINGANTPMLSILNPSLADAGGYDCVVTNDCRSVTSNTALLSNCTGCVGDVNCNCTVNLSDLSVLLAHFGTLSGAALADGDLDADGDVDLSDLSQLLANFGTVCP
ncbi:MAG: immunoglobulin domain-containing protein [Phycisphaerae bacterium]